MRKFILLTSALFISASLLAADCASAVKVDHHTRDGKLELTAKNISSKAMVAYVIATGSHDSNGNLSQVFSGVFTNGDSLRPGASINVGTAASAPNDLKPVIDYIRRADG